MSFLSRFFGRDVAERSKADPNLTNCSFGVVQRNKIIANAETLIAKGKIEAAIKEYEHLLEESPNDVNALNRIADLLFRINRNDEGRKILINIADHYVKQGLFLKAIAYYKNANKVEPSIDIDAKIADLYAMQGLPTEAKGSASTRQVANVKSSEHYMLKCIECDFTHHVPRDRIDNDFRFSVDVDACRMTCVYGPAGHPRQFVVTLEMKEFFMLTTVPESGQILEASIGPNMRALHGHLLSHCDPLFLIIRQSQNHTEHQYTKKPEGNTYVKFSAEHGIDVVGVIDVAKAEIPGVSE